MTDAERAREVSERLRRLFKARDPRAPRLLGELWETGVDTGLLHHIVRQLPRPARACMDAAMWRAYAELPEEFICFRGCDEHSRKGCSWSRQPAYALCANFWVNRRGRRIVLVGRVLKRNVRFVIAGAQRRAGAAGEIVVPFGDVSLVAEQEIPDEVVSAVEHARQDWADGRRERAEDAIERVVIPYGETIGRLLEAGLTAVH